MPDSSLRKIHIFKGLNELKNGVSISFPVSSSVWNQNTSVMIICLNNKKHILELFVSGIYFFTTGSPELQRTGSTPDWRALVGLCATVMPGDYN